MARRKFWDCVTKTESCWLWNGFIDRDGYGRAKGGAASRRAWELTNGPIPDGLDVLHKCDVRACVRPDHLFLGTHQDNMTDMVCKGRTRGNRFTVGNAARRGHGKRLDYSKAEQIRALYRNGLSQQAIADQFGVSQVMVSRVVLNRNWI